jgi:transmembrane sensor
MTELARELTALGDHVRAEQDARFEAEHSLGAVRGRLVDSERRWRSTRPRALRRGLLLAGALGALGAAIVSARLLRPSLTASAANQALRAGDWIRVRGVAVPLKFSDGTSITLDPGSRARLEAVDAAGARLAIETGHADVKVVPGRNGRWHLSVGPFGVDVTGTQFDIGWDPDAEELSLNMHEGKVIVSGCVLGDGRPLQAGEHLTASCRERRFEVVPATASSVGSQPADSADALSAQVGAAAAPAARSDSAATAPPSFIHAEASPPAADSWRALAHAGKYDAALNAANNLGFELEMVRSSAEDLSLLGDIARFGGDTGEAIRAYISLRRRFPHTLLSANAAFALGRVAFDQRGAFEDAARWFANYLAEQPRGPLAREAQGREMEALDRSGDHQGARRVAASYQKSYPRGPHIHLAERLLATD